MGRVIKFCALSESGDLMYALQVFDVMPHPDAFIYNVLIRAHMQRRLARDCILLYSQMLSESVTPNRFTFPSLIKACCTVEEGRQVHAHVLKFGSISDAYSMNSLIHMYVNCERLEEARRVFDKMPRRNVVSCTTLISGYSQWGCVDEAFELFELMHERNSASWNAMMAAFVQNNCFQEAFALFRRMQSENLLLDKYVAATMLSACKGSGALKQGEWIHGYMQKSGIEMDPKLVTAIIDMYCKCGCLDKAFEVFNGLPHKAISSWNAMIGGLALHGKGMAAVELLNEMERRGISPDYITFVNVLNACAHSGLVEEGRHYFRYMTEVHDIAPGSEHYGCMVDLLGRAGLLEEAKELINEMPTSPDASVLGALLGACRIHGNVELGEEIGKRVIQLDPFNSGRYVLLANMYASAGRWAEVGRVRKVMNDRGVNKPAGFSMIELDGVVNEFVAGGRDHPLAEEIYAKVEEMLEGVRTAGYVADTNGVLLHDVEEEERENPLHYHSEKLAIALGLLKTKSGETLRITKNLRICKDCHTVSKLVSQVFDREIIIRDRNRFHHFKGGDCSCNGYW